jgi:hypothetical protein
MRTDYRRFIILLIIGVLSIGCTDLDLPNELEPDQKRVLSDIESVMDIAGNSFRGWHNGMQDFYSLAFPLAVMADHLTCSWGITRDYSWEPRNSVPEYPNSTEWSYSFQQIGQWEESYKAIHLSNSILRWLDEAGSTITEEQNALLEAFSLFTSGVSHGYLGLVFDQAVVVEYNSIYSNAVPVPWGEVIEKSLEMLDKSIEISEAISFSVPPDWVGGQEMTNLDLAALANGYAARILAYSSRTKAHNDAIDWNRVLSYAQNGLEVDFEPYLGIDWFDDYWVYGRMYGWGRVDMRIVNLMDHDYPSRWPADNSSWNTPDGSDPGPATPGDDRLLSDFSYLNDNTFPPDRGYYHWSHYRFSRYDYLSATVWYGIGPRPTFMAWEVRLIEAEALLRLGDSEGAIAILNDVSGPRKVRGGLPDVLLSDDILRYILDEKEIECFCTGTGISFFDMRRTDRLQRGTWLHFPIPATELGLLLVPHYTIHSFFDGIDGSAGNWTGWDE